MDWEQIFHCSKDAIWLYEQAYELFTLFQSMALLPSCCPAEGN